MPHVRVYPGTTENPIYQVGGKSFVFFRNPRPTRRTTTSSSSGSRTSPRSRRSCRTRVAVLHHRPLRRPPVRAPARRPGGRADPPRAGRVVQDAWLSGVAPARACSPRQPLPGSPSRAGATPACRRASVASAWRSRPRARTRRPTSPSAPTTAAGCRPRSPPRASSSCQVSDAANTPSTNAAPRPEPDTRSPRPAVRTTKYTAVVGFTSVSATKRPSTCPAGASPGRPPAAAARAARGPLPAAGRRHRPAAPAARARPGPADQGAGEYRGRGVPEVDEGDAGRAGRRRRASRA
jgi:hypothetical protein